MRLREKIKNLDFEAKESIFSIILTLILSGMLLAAVANLMNLLIFLLFPIYYFGGICFVIKLYVIRREKLKKYLAINSWIYCFLPEWWREENIEFKRYID